MDNGPILSKVNPFQTVPNYCGISEILETLEIFLICQKHHILNYDKKSIAIRMKHRTLFHHYSHITLSNG